MTTGCSLNGLSSNSLKAYLTNRHAFGSGRQTKRFSAKGPRWADGYEQAVSKWIKTRENQLPKKEYP